jgi:hypothetical protein
MSRRSSHSRQPAPAAAAARIAVTSGPTLPSLAALSIGGPVRLDDDDPEVGQLDSLQLGDYEANVDTNPRARILGLRRELRETFDAMAWEFYDEGFGWRRILAASLWGLYLASDRGRPLSPFTRRPLPRDDYELLKLQFGIVASEEERQQMVDLERRMNWTGPWQMSERYRERYAAHFERYGGGGEDEEAKAEQAARRRREFGDDDDDDAAGPSPELSEADRRAIAALRQEQDEERRRHQAAQERNVARDGGDEGLRQQVRDLVADDQDRSLTPEERAQDRQNVEEALARSLADADRPQSPQSPQPARAGVPAAAGGLVQFALRWRIYLWGSVRELAGGTTLTERYAFERNVEDQTTVWIQGRFPGSSRGWGGVTARLVHNDLAPLEGYRRREDFEPTPVNYLVFELLLPGAVAANQVMAFLRDASSDAVWDGVLQLPDNVFLTPEEHPGQYTIVYNRALPEAYLPDSLRQPRQELVGQSDDDDDDDTRFITWRVYLWGSWEDLVERFGIDNRGQIDISVTTSVHQWLSTQGVNSPFRDLEVTRGFIDNVLTPGYRQVEVYRDGVTLGSMSHFDFIQYVEPELYDELLGLIRSYSAMPTPTAAWANLMDIPPDLVVDPVLHPDQFTILSDARLERAYAPPGLQVRGAPPPGPPAPVPDQDQGPQTPPRRAQPGNLPPTPNAPARPARPPSRSATPTPPARPAQPAPPAPRALPSFVGMGNPQGGEAGPSNDTDVLLQRQFARLRTEPGPYTVRWRIYNWGPVVGSGVIDEAAEQVAALTAVYFRLRFADVSWFPPDLPAIDVTWVPVARPGYRPGGSPINRVPLGAIDFRYTFEADEGARASMLLRALFEMSAADWTEALDGLRWGPRLDLVRNLPDYYRTPLLSSSVTDEMLPPLEVPDPLRQPS